MPARSAAARAKSLPFACDAGHVHAYERTNPMLNYTSNACGTTHILIGAPTCRSLPAHCAMRSTYRAWLSWGDPSPTWAVVSTASMQRSVSWPAAVPWRLRRIQLSVPDCLLCSVTGDGGNGAATTSMVDVGGCPGTGTNGATDPGAGNSNYVQYPTLVQGYPGGFCSGNATYPGLVYCPTSQPEWSAWRCALTQAVCAVCTLMHADRRAL